MGTLQQLHVFFTIFFKEKILKIQIFFNNPGKLLFFFFKKKLILLFEEKQFCSPRLFSDFSQFIVHCTQP